FAAAQRRTAASAPCIGGRLVLCGAGFPGRRRRLERELDQADAVPPAFRRVQQDGEHAAAAAVDHGDEAATGGGRGAGLEAASARRPARGRTRSASVASASAACESVARSRALPYCPGASWPQGSA